MRFCFLFSFFLICMLSLSGCAQQTSPNSEITTSKVQKKEPHGRKMIPASSYHYMRSKRYPQYGMLKILVTNDYNKRKGAIHTLAIFRKDGSYFPLVTGQTIFTRRKALAREFGTRIWCKGRGVQAVSGGRVAKLSIVPKKYISASVRCNP